MKIGFALEYSLGHITHSDNLKRFLAAGGVGGGIDPVYVDIAYDTAPMPALLRPMLKQNWSVRASLAARRGLLPRARELSACFFHTQVTSLFCADLMRRVPSVVSLDATPLQYDGLGAFYKHAPGPAPLEAAKRALNVRAYTAAAHLVTWSRWAKDSLVADYGMPPAKITVIAPGIDLAAWRVERGAARGDDRPPTFLFVGGDFERKGGAALLEAFQLLREGGGGGGGALAAARLLIATKTLPESFSAPGVEVHRGLTPNSPGLRALYARADVFVFPTLGDCLPLAVMEALAAGLPVVTSSVGALGEAVTDGECGLVIPAGHAPELCAAMTRLAGDAALRARMSAAAVERARERFDAQANYSRLIALLTSLAA